MDELNGPYLLAKLLGRRTVYHPAPQVDVDAWVVSPHDACHYVTRESAEQAIVELERGGVVLVDGLHVVPTPLSPLERVWLAFGWGDR